MEDTQPAKMPGGKANHRKTSESSAKAPNAVVPGKRDNDDIQFVSSNPVKKRKIDDRGPSPAIGQSSNHVPHAMPRVPNTEAALFVNNGVPSSDRKGSAGMLVLPWEASSPGSDINRGTSVPLAMENFGFPMSFSSALKKRRSSPALSPKQLPKHSPPSPANAEAIRPLPDALGCQDDTQMSDRPSAINPFGVSTHPNEICPSTAEPRLVQVASRPSGKPGVTEAPEALQISIQTPNDLASSASATNINSLNNTCKGKQVTSNTHPSSQISPTKLPTGAVSGLLGHAKATGSDSKSNRDPVTRQAICGPPPGLAKDRLAPPPSSSNGASISQTSKSPCRLCIEARLRRQAATMNHGLQTSSHLQPVLPTSGGGFTRGSWDSPLGVVPPQTKFIAPPYGQLNHQSVANNLVGQIPSITLTSANMQSPYVAGGDNLQTGNQKPTLTVRHPVVRGLATSSTKPQKQPCAPKPPITNNTKSIATIPQATVRVPQTQPNGKHIIVDIADTCMSVFPFDEVAQRHHQPTQKVKDIFDAVIQVPLLRCVTDKRRAGKLGTSRVKEFNQAKKELQAPADPSRQQQDKQQQSASASAREVAQFMGPEGTRPSVLKQFPGPW